MPSIEMESRSPFFALKKACSTNFPMRLARNLSLNVFDSPIGMTSLFEEIFTIPSVVLQKK